MNATILSFFAEESRVEYVVSLKNCANSFETARFSLFFSELALLHKKIQDSCGKTPQIPRKFENFGRSFEEIAERARKIEQYLNKLLKIDDFRTKTALEAFVKAKTAGSYDFFKELSQKSEFRGKTEKIVEENEKNQENTSIFQGKEYVIEGEIKENQGFCEEISFDPLRKPKKIENREKNSKKTLNFFERIFVSCCNYS